MSKQIVKVPDLGGASDVEVIELCVTSGEEISEGQSLIVVESDKASMEVPSPLSGKVIDIVVKVGDEVSEGDTILELTVSGEAAVAESAKGVEVTSDAEIISSVEMVSSAEMVSSDLVGQSEKENNSSPSKIALEAVSVPDLGGADQVELIEILVSVGDEVSEGDSLIVMESDKASMDMPSPVSGRIAALHVTLGANLSEGDLVVDIETVATTPEDKSVETPAYQTSTSKKSVDPASSSKSSTTSVAIPPNISPESQPKSSAKQGLSYAGPAVRKLARELGVDLAKVTGTGPKSRVAKEDLHNFVKQLVGKSAAGTVTGGSGIPLIPEVDFSLFGEVDIQPMSKLHKLTAANMQRSWLNVPHVTQYDDADITDLEFFRKSLKPQMEKRGIKVSPLPFIVKAVATALKENQAFNVSLGGDGETIVYKKYIHIGMAVDTPAGLMVPVIRNVDQKGIWELSEEILELATKAKTRKLKPAEMQGGCFTISSLGGIGGTGFTPIVNAPEVGILGVSKLAVKPVFRNDEFEPRKILPLSLSYDHRAVNGGDAGRFLTFLVEQLGDVRHLLL